MKRTLVDFISGIAIYLLLSVVIGVSVVMRVLPGQFDEWLGSSSSPREALIYFSLSIGSILLILTRVGIEINLFNIAKGDNFKRYAAGLPLWFLFISLAVTVIQFYRFYPACKTPETISFQIVGEDQTYLPFDVIELPKGSSFTMNAQSLNGDVLLSCLSWEMTGTAFETLGQKDGCQVNIQVSDQPGIGYITLLASQNFCSQATLFSIEVHIVEP